MLIYWTFITQCSKFHTPFSTKIFEQMKAIYPKHDLPKVVKEMCHRCAQVAREQTREVLEKEIDNSYNDLRTNT